MPYMSLHTETAHIRFKQPGKPSFQKSLIMSFKIVSSLLKAGGTVLAVWCKL